MDPQGLVGLVGIVALAWGISERRGAVPWRYVGVGLALQLVIALILLKLPYVQYAFIALNFAVQALQDATREGASFVFGYLAGGPAPFEIIEPNNMFILAFRALPLILVVSALSAILFHWRILPAIVDGVGWALRRSMGVGGALAVGSAANIFVGMVEAPLLIRPYLKRITRAELFALMTMGMATIAGTVMVIYATVLETVIPNAMGHIVTASLISAPAALAIAALMVPERAEPTAGGLDEEDPAAGTMDALVRGTGSGIQLLLNVTAMLIVLVALVALVNIVLGLAPNVAGEAITVQRIFGWMFAPVAWAIGVPWVEAAEAGRLLGTKVALNEFIAYLDMAALPPDALSDRSRLILVYALCGFANFGSLGIMVGGLATMVPERRSEIAGLGMKSILSGFLATCMTGAWVGLL